MLRTYSSEGLPNLKRFQKIRLIKQFQSSMINISIREMFTNLS
jgi:hypothetical protein